MTLEELKLWDACVLELLKQGNHWRTAIRGANEIFAARRQNEITTEEEILAEEAAIEEIENG